MCINKILRNITKVVSTFSNQGPIQRVNLFCSNVCSKCQSFRMLLGFWGAKNCFPGSWEPRSGGAHRSSAHSWAPCITTTTTFSVTFSITSTTTHEHWQGTTRSYYFWNMKPTHTHTHTQTHTPLFWLKCVWVTAPLSICYWTRRDFYSSDSFLDHCRMVKGVILLWEHVDPFSVPQACSRRSCLVLPWLSKMTQMH